MRSTSTTAACGWTWEPETAEGEIPAAYDFEITGTVTAGEPPVMYDSNGTGYPGSGMEVEITGATLVKVHDEAGDHPGLPYPFHENIEALFLSLVEATPELRASIEEALCEAASAAHDPANRADELYDRWKDSGGRRVVA